MKKKQDLINFYTIERPIEQLEMNMDFEEPDEYYEDEELRRRRTK